MIGWLALILWPGISVYFYNRLSLPLALCATLLGGYLFLPVKVGIDLPLLPPFDKISIPVLTALVLTAVALRRKNQPHPVLDSWLPRNPVVLGLMALLIVGIFASVQTNGDTLVYGPRVIQGLRLYDAFSIMLELSIVIIPFFLARRVLSSVEGQRILLLAIVVSAVGYALLALYEIRMSPQLHTKIYGFFQHSFAQHIRNDGFRPLVFMDHGLSLGIFLVYAVIGAVGLFRATSDSTRWKWAAAAAWLFAVLVLSKAFGALLIALVLLPIAVFLTPRMQLMVAASIAVIVMTYPMLRAAQIIPLEEIHAFALDISPQRADSLMTRIENEEGLLAKAQERPLFGWGGWGRNRVFDEEGRNLGLTDGSWVIELGTGGWFRYIAIFGLLCWPAVGMFIAKRDKVDALSATIALMLAAKLVDLVPNSGMPALVWVMAGSLIGRLEIQQGSARQAADAAAAAKSPAARPGYIREQPALVADTRDKGSKYTRDFPDKKDKRDRSGAGEKIQKAAASYKRPKPASGYRR